MSDNLILMTDSYKLTHFDQYPPNTDGVFSYFESRNGAKYPHTLFFGLQYLLKRYLDGPVITAEKIDEAEALAVAHMGSDKMFNRAGWERILNKHGGYLPLKIRAVPEGTLVPVSNVLMTVENTDPDCYWLTNYIETLLTHVWYPSTVATLSYEVKRMIWRYLKTTGSEGSLGGLPFMLHDFGYRGTTSEEAAAIGGAAHLVNFKGTDTLAAMRLAHEFYGASYDDLAFSVPATEHSIMTARGREGELDVLDQLLDNYPTGILSVVSDSYNIYDFVTAVCSRADQILNRDGVFVVRPDSPTDNHQPAELTAWIVRKLEESFGSSVVRSESNGEVEFRALDSHVRVLWGDGIGPDGIDRILDTLKFGGYSAENMVFGMGGGLLQRDIDRDTQRFAFKSSAQRQAGGEWHDVTKEPLDPTKRSKGGRLALIHTEGAPHFATVREEEHKGANLLHPVFDSGVLLNEQTFSEIRARAEFA